MPTIREISEEAYGAWFRSPDDEDPAGWREFISRAILNHAASHLRSLGEQEKTYALQDCMERAARAIEEME